MQGMEVTLGSQRIFTYRDYGGGIFMHVIAVYAEVHGKLRFMNIYVVLELRVQYAVGWPTNCPADLIYVYMMQSVGQSDFCSTVEQIY
jgi:hypothetical protein